MVGRLAIRVAVATCFLTTGSLYAQGMAPPSMPAGVGPSPYSAPASYGPQSGPPISDPSCQGWTAGMSACGPGCNPQGNHYMECDGSSVHADLGQACDDVDHTPLEDIICRAARNVNVRLDYLHWSISKPHTTLIGAQPSLAEMNNDFFPNSKFGDVDFDTPPLQRDPRTPFEVSPQFDGFAYDTGPVILDDNDGIRGTLIFPMTYGTVEIGGFYVHRANGDINPGFILLPTSTSTLIPVIPLSQNGQPSSTVLLFSQGINASFSSLVFGAEANIVFKPIVPKERGLIWMPIIGFRYLGIQERFDVAGFNAGAPTSMIQSTTINNMYGPQAGMRFEFLTKWFTIGAEPKFMLGVNQAAAGVDSFDPTIGTAHDHQSYLTLAPVGALDVYAKIPLHEHIRFFVAYNLLGTGFVSRPNEQIVYDTNSSGDNNIHLSIHHSAFLVQGYSLGVEFNF
jgi:hypothetical protein